MIHVPEGGHLGMIRELTFSDLHEHFKTFSHQHFKEVDGKYEVYKGYIVNPDFESYEWGMSHGHIKGWGCFGSDGEVLGYLIYKLSTDLKYGPDRLHAFQDVFYVRPDVRASGLATDLIRFAEHQLLAHGVDMVFQFTKSDPSLDFSKALEHWGYTELEKTYVKRLT